MRGRRRMDEGATPPPGSRPSLSRSHTGTSDPGTGDISLEMDMQDVSLDGEEVLQDVAQESPSRSDLIASPPYSPSPRRLAKLQDDGLDCTEGDITTAGSPSTDPTAAWSGPAIEVESQDSSLDNVDESQEPSPRHSPIQSGIPALPISRSFAQQHDGRSDDPEDEPEEGISASVSPPRRTTVLPNGPVSPNLRSLTPVRSRSRSPSASPSARHIPLPPDSPIAGASSSTISLPRSVHTSQSESSRSLDLQPGSPHRSEQGFHSRKPSIPAAIPIQLNGKYDIDGLGDEDYDGNDNTDTGFESIPISTTPPKSPTVPLPSSPRLHLDASKKDSKRRSWNGFGVNKEDKGKKRTSWLNGAPAASTVEHATRSAPMTRAGSSKSASIPDNQEGQGSAAVENGESSAGKPRLHAPPAHPHPFPLPSTTSPTTSSNKRLSVTALPTDPGTSAPPGGIGAKGLSAFEKIVNHTRPSHLPPKPKDEDDTHYHQWEQMMAQAREHEKERRKLQDLRRLEKEKRLAAATPLWDVLLSDSSFSAAKVKGDKALREMWFHGVPGYLRGKAWGLAIGNPLAMSKDSYKTYVSRARKALDSGRFPPGILESMNADMDRTLPQLKLFGRKSPMRADLQEFICAWVVYRSDDGLGYAPYVSHIAAMLLLPSPPAQAFLQLCNLLARPCLQAFVTETKDEIDAFYRVFENLQADMFPKIYANCKNLGLQLPESYFRSMLLEQVPFEACCRLWDQIVLDGDGYIFRSALAIFGFLEPRLHYPDKQEILSVLEGRNRATLAITEREKERAKLKGEAFDEELDGKLSVFGLNEDALFDWLARDDWRESRYERLVTREMPD